MPRSTLLYIAWPLTLGLSFIAGSIDFSSESTNENSKEANPSSRTSHRNSSPNGSVRGNSAAINRRSSTTRYHITQDSYVEPYDTKEVFSTSDPQKRVTKLLRMIDQLGPGDFEQVVDDFRKLGVTKKRMAEYEILLNAWAKINPEGALAYATKNTNTTFATTAILKAWAAYAPHVAIQWVKLNHTGANANQYLVDVIAGIASSNHRLATNMMPDLVDFRDRRATVATIAKHVSQLNPARAIAWLDTIKGYKGSFIHSIASESLAYSLATKDPQATIDWLKTFPADKQKTDYGTAIALAWAELDINKAAEWTSSLKESARSNAASHIIRQFASSDPDKAVTWLKSMSDDSSYQTLVWKFLDATSTGHPKIALANLGQLRDSKRERYKASIIQNWAATDKGAATQWMRNKGMDSAAQEKFLSYNTAAPYPPYYNGDEHIIRYH